ncbi:class I SAM-dependent methyltransferase [Streptomyces sp. NPDC002676]
MSTVTPRAAESSLEYAADLAAVAALLQIGAELGVDQLLDSGEDFTAAELARYAGVPQDRAAGYLRALAAAGLLVDTGTGGRHRVSDDYPALRYQTGYVSWAMSANGPFIMNARGFFTDGETAARHHRRDGRRVAVSSRWIGEQAFYPPVLDRVEAAGAQRVVDLGAGAGRLLIQQLQRDATRTGVAVDISAAACVAAREAAEEAGVGDRLQVVERSVESLVDDPAPIEGADVIQACFVMHDVNQDPAVLDAVLGRCREALADNGFMAVVDAVSYAPHPRERRFSALFTYLHADFMGVRLPSEREWEDKFRAAGFSKVECEPQVFPGGRLFVATK